MRVTFLVVTIVVFFNLLGCGGTKKNQVTVPEVSVEFYSSQTGLPSDHVTCAAVVGDQVWVGTKNGIARFDGTNWQIYMRKNTGGALLSDIIEGLYVAETGLYVATENGVARFDGNQWASVYSGGRARSVAVKGPLIAVGTAHGIEYSSDGKKFYAFDKENAGLCFDEVTVVTYDRKGKLWVGTRQGIAAFNGSVFSNFTGPDKMVMGTTLVDVPPNPPNCRLIGNNIKCILPYKDKLAIGTTLGLTITDMENSWVSYTAQHKDFFQRGDKIVEEDVAGNSPMPGNIINALAATTDDSVLFIGTNKGIIALRGDQWIDIHSKIAKNYQGPITAIAVQRDILWVGTNSGIFRVNNIPKLLGNLSQ